ncbi:hypothetical protein [Thomasclavelia cocleata]|uniref:hypothetical protein n=1 Tax=Thomasclavelia cocleata TaxID=69824 RepID=UPI00249429FD|nr:hypothetical protein [Thomasclavelia cocleata]
MGEAFKVVPIDKLSSIITLVLIVILLYEDVSMKSAVGSLLIIASILCMVL